MHSFLTMRTKNCIICLAQISEILTDIKIIIQREFIFEELGNYSEINFLPETQWRHKSLFLLNLRICIHIGSEKTLLPSSWLMQELHRTHLISCARESCLINGAWPLFAGGGPS